MVYGTIAAVEWKNEGELGRVVPCRVVSYRVVSCRVVSRRVVSCRVGSCRVVSGGVGSDRVGRVGSGRVNTVFTRSKPHRTTVTIAPCTVHFVLLHERLGQAILSINKLSLRKRKRLRCRIQLQVTTTNIIYESVVEPLIKKEESRVRKNESNHVSYT